MRCLICSKYSLALRGRPKPQDETFDPARNASMDSPPRKSLETIIEGRTSPELYSDPFDHRFAWFLHRNLAKDRCEEHRAKPKRPPEGGRHKAKAGAASSALTKVTNFGFRALQACYELACSKRHSFGLGARRTLWGSTSRAQRVRLEAGGAMNEDRSERRHGMSDGLGDGLQEGREGKTGDERFSLLVAVEAQILQSISGRAPLCGILNMPFPGRLIATFATWFR